jgi:magnesium transporter
MPDATSARDLLDDARLLIEGEEWSKLLVLTGALHPADMAELVLLLDEDQRRLFVGHLPPDVIGQMFEFSEDSDLEELVESVQVGQLPAALAGLDDDVVADVLQELDDEDRADTLAALNRTDDIESLLEYEDESAGSLMSRGFVALNEWQTVQSAIEYLRLTQPPSSRAYYLYIIDRDRRLVGNLSIRDLLVSSPQTRLGDITNRDVHAVTTETDQEEAARLLQKYNLLAVPVVDEDSRLVGVTLADDLIDVVREEATEDMYRMVGLDEDETAGMPIRRTIRLRLPWLLVNVFTAFAGAFVVSQFDGTLERAVVLAAFLPVVANQSGVTGTQTATIIVRTLAIRGSVGSLWRQLLRELLVGLTNGFVVGCLLSVVAFIFTGNDVLSLVLLVTMTLASGLATVVGQLVPVILRSVGADPALASSIFVTMMTDAMSFLLLLGIASVVIDQLA